MAGYIVLIYTCYMYIYFLIHCLASSAGHLFYQVLQALHDPAVVTKFRFYLQPYLGFDVHTYIHDVDVDVDVDVLHVHVDIHVDVDVHVYA